MWPAKSPIVRQKFFFKDPPAKWRLSLVWGQEVQWWSNGTLKCISPFTKSEADRNWYFCFVQLSVWVDFTMHTINPTRRQKKLFWGPWMALPSLRSKHKNLQRTVNSVSRPHPVFILSAYLRTFGVSAAINLSGSVWHLICKKSGPRSPCPDVLNPKRGCSALTCLKNCTK